MTTPSNTPATREEQLATLKGRAGQIQQALENIQSHINDLEAEGERRVIGDEHADSSGVGR